MYSRGQKQKPCTQSIILKLKTSTSHCHFDWLAHLRPHALTKRYKVLKCPTWIWVRFEAINKREHWNDPI